MRGTIEERLKKAQKDPAAGFIRAPEPPATRPYDRYENRHEDTPEEKQHEKTVTRELLAISTLAKQIAEADKGGKTTYTQYPCCIKFLSSKVAVDRNHFAPGRHRYIFDVQDLAHERDSLLSVTSQGLRDEIIKHFESEKHPLDVAVVIYREGEGYKTQYFLRAYDKESDALDVHTRIIELSREMKE